MAVPLFLVRADMEKRVGSEKIEQYFDDDVDGDLADDDEAVQDVLCQAESDGFAILLKSYPSTDQIVLLVQNDDGLRNHFAWIAVNLASERRVEFTAEDGGGAHRVQHDRALKHMEDLMRSKRRSKGEAVAGKGRTAGGKLQPRPPATTAAAMQFAPTKASPTGRGGF